MLLFKNSIQYKILWMKKFWKLSYRNHKNFENHPKVNSFRNKLPKEMFVKEGKKKEIYTFTKRGYNKIIVNLIKAVINAVTYLDV